jgi:lipopolysaccharide export system permease protein
MPKILYRSVVKELSITFFLTLAFLNAILMMEKMLRLSRLLSGVGATLHNMAKIIFYLQPQLMLLTIPMSLLLCILLVYGRMNQDNEIIILRASGMDFKKISVPVFLFGLCCFGASLAVSFYFGPAGSVRLRDEITRTIAVGSTRAVEEGTFNSSFKDIVILVKGKKGDILEDIFIYDNRNKEEPKVLVAREGELFIQNGLNIALSLKNGYINITKGRDTTELFFDRYQLGLSIDSESKAPPKNEFTPLQLLRKMKEAVPDREKTSYALAFHRRLTLPLICVALIFLGLPLAHLSGKSGRLGGLAVGLLVFVLYYVLLIYGENLASAGRIPPYIGAWMPSGALALLALLLYRRESTR